LRVFKRSGITIRWAISCLSLAIPRHARATCNIQIRVDTNFRDAGAIARGASLGAILGGQRRCLSSCASASKTAARVDEPLPVPAGYQLRQKTAVAEAKREKPPRAPRVFWGAGPGVPPCPRPTVLVGVFFFGSTSVLVMGASCLILFWDIVPKR